MAAKSIVILILVITAFEGLNADTLLKRSPLFFNDLAKNTEEIHHTLHELYNNFTDKFYNWNVTTSKRSPIMFNDMPNTEEIHHIFHELYNNFTDKFFNWNVTTSKRSPWIIEDWLVNTIAEGAFGKRSLEDLSNKVQEIKSELQKDGQLAKQKFNEFWNNLTQYIKGNKENNTTVSKRSPGIIEDWLTDKFADALAKAAFGKRSLFSADDVNNLFKNFQSGLDGIVQKVKSALAANANSTNVLDSLKNFVSNFVSNKINLNEITADISECAGAEKQNVTNVHDATKAALENVLAQEEQKAAPFVKNVSVTAPKVANLVMQTYASYSSCAQTNVVCIVQVITNAMNQAKALEPEVTQEIQQGEALFQSIIADSNVIKQTIDSAFAQMKAIGEETVDCIKGKINA